MLYLYFQSGYHDEHDKHSMDHLIEFMRAGRVKVTQRRKWDLFRQSLLIRVLTNQL